MKTRSASILTAGVILLVGLVFCIPGVQAAPGSTAPFLGKLYTGDDGSAVDGYLDAPKGFSFGTNGSLIIADSANNVIRQLSSDGYLSTYAGGGEYGTLDGFRPATTWSEPEGITHAGGGVFYVADTGSSRIRKIDGTTVSTLSIPGLKRPNAVLVSGTTLYISDTGNNRIVRATTSGGTPTVVAADLGTPLKMTLLDGKLYVAELESGKVLSLDTSTNAKTVLASGFTEPRAITSSNGLLYLAAGPSGIYNEIWRITPATGAAEMLARRIETEWLNQTSDILVGTWNGAPRIILLQNGGSSIFTTDIDGQDLQQIAGRHRFGDEQGAGSVALMGRPQELVFSRDGSKLFVAYAQGNKIAEYNILTDTVRVVAGHLMDNYREGVGEFARFSDVTTMAIAPDNKTLYLADRNSHRIRTLDVTTNTTSYLTGAGVLNLIDPNNPTGVIDVNFSNGYQEGGPCATTFTTGAAGCAYFNRPTGLALTRDGKTLYVADAGNHRVRKIDTATGQTSHVAGSGTKGLVNGAGTAASFNGPFTLALSSDEKTLYVVDKGNHAVRAITLATKNVTTLVGTGKQGYREGAFANAVLAIPEYLELGPDGNLYLAEAGSLRIRKLDLTRKETSLVAGSGERGKRDGAGALSEWSGPKGLAFSSDRLFVADFKNDLIRVISLAGQVPDAPATVATAEKQFFAFPATTRSGFAAAAGEVNDDGAVDLIVGAGPGQEPLVRVYTPSGTQQKQFLAYGSALRTGIRVATCDLNNDDQMDIVTIPGKGAPPHVRTFDGNGLALGKGFFALNGAFRGGASIACGDIAGGGTPEIIVSALEGGGPHVTIYSPGGRLLGSFMAYDRRFRGGIEVGLADIDGNGLEEIITVPSKGSTHVQYFTGAGRRISPGFFAFETGFKGGGTVAGGDMDGDGTDELLVGTGPGRANELRIFSKRGVRVRSLRPYAPGFQGGLRVGASDLDGDNRDEGIVLPASAGAPQLRTFNLL